MWPVIVNNIIPSGFYIHFTCFFSSSQLVTILSLGTGSSVESTLQRTNNKQTNNTNKQTTHNKNANKQTNKQKNKTKNKQTNKQQINKQTTHHKNAIQDLLCKITLTNKRLRKNHQLSPPLVPRWRPLKPIKENQTKY